MIRIFTAFAAVLVWAMSAAIAPAAAADKVVLMLNWYVYGEHAPFYYGKAKGIYAAEGIDLEIQEGRGSAATTQAVAAKTANFGYVDIPTMMRAAIKGAPVIATGVLLQTSPMSVMGLADKNIRKPEDIKGKTVAITPADSMTQIWPLFLKKTGLKESDFKTVAGDGQTKLNAVINGQADLLLGYVMDTAQRGMGLDWPTSLELIQRSVAAAKPRDALVFSGAGTDHLAADDAKTLDDVIRAYEEQLAAVEKAGGRIILMASRALARLGRNADDYGKVYNRILSQVRESVIIHWLGDMFGFGQDGPYAAKPAYDDLLQGGSGLSHLIARAGDGTPLYVPTALADRVVGLSAVGAILASLLHRDRTGQGQRVDIPMFETMVGFVMATP